MRPPNSGSPAATFTTALRRTSSLTGTDCQPEALSSPRVATVGGGVRGAADMRSTLPPDPETGSARWVPCSAMDLSGPWRAALADDDLRRGALGLDYDDDGWEPVPVPGPWRSVPALPESRGPLLRRPRLA